MTATILTDIEGTTSSVAFVKEVLFPYARRELPSYIRAHISLPAVQTSVAAVAEEEGIAPSNIEGVIAALGRWIAEDRKATPLKALQGLVWEAGYRNGDYRAHMYPDAVARLQAWHSQQIPIYVYSSGSVLAQKLFFQHSEAGDISSLFAGHFDTTVGAKKEVDSYRTILNTIGATGPNVTFLSDVESELDAASEAELRTYHVVRDGQPPSQRHPVVSSLDEVTLVPKRS